MFHYGKKKNTGHYQAVMNARFSYTTSEENIRIPMLRKGDRSMFSRYSLLVQWSQTRWGWIHEEVVKIIK